MIMSRVLRIGALLLLSGLSLGLLFFVFEYQYMWHVKHLQYLILRGGFAAGAAIVIALWIFFPSYWAVAAAGVLILVFPVFVPDVPSMSLSLAFSATMAVAIALLIGTTALRRYLFPQ
jgi:hypothetical protein